MERFLKIFWTKYVYFLFTVEEQKKYFLSYWNFYHAFSFFLQMVVKNTKHIFYRSNVTVLIYLKKIFLLYWNVFQTLFFFL